MAVTYRAMGTLEPVLYFENAQGQISLPPTTEDAYHIKDEMRKRGYELREADTLPKIDILQKRLQDELLKEHQQTKCREEIHFGAIRKQIRERLYSRMISAGTSAVEREFIKKYLMLREESRPRWQHVPEAYMTLRECNSTKHIKDAVDNAPEMKDDTCVRCGKFRRARDSKYCMTCIDTIMAQG